MKSKNEVERLLDANKAFMDLTIKIVTREFNEHELLVWDKIAKDTSGYIQQMRKDVEPFIKEIKENPN